MAFLDVQAVPTAVGRQLFLDVLRGFLPAGALASALAASYYKIGEKGFLLQPGGTQIPASPDDTGNGYSTKTALAATGGFTDALGNRTFHKSLGISLSTLAANVNVPAPAAGERRIIIDSGTVNPGAVAATPGTLVEWTGAAWTSVLTSSGDAYRAAQALTVAAINGLSPQPAGTRVLVGTAGVVTSGALTVSVGDVIEFDGAVWLPGLVLEANFTLRAACSLLIGEANPSPAPDLDLFEIGVFIPIIPGYGTLPTLLSYGTFPSEPKNNTIALTNNVRFSF